MKKKLIISGLLLSIFAIRANLQEKFSRSFMFTRPIYFNLARQNSLWHSIVYSKDRKDLKGGTQVQIAYQESSPLRKVARYFMPTCTNELLISGDDNTRDLNDRNVRAEWLGLPSNFRGFMTLSPQQRQYGLMLEYNQELKELFDIPFINDYWLAVQMPITHVENNLRIKQSELQNQGTDPKDIIEAFNQTSWHFGKISPTKRSETGVAEIVIKLGKTFMAEDHFQLVYYSGITVPTAQHQNPKYLFDPFAGNNGHFGFLAGVNMQLLLNRDPSKFAWCFFAAIETSFLARDSQTRTFDLKGKPWSRFMQFVKKGDSPTKTFPGVNVLTRKVTARPYNFVDFSTGWRIKTGKVEFEIGYSIWGHGDEELRLREQCKIGGVCDKGEFGIAAPVTDTLPDGTAATASASTINEQATVDMDDTVHPVINKFVAIIDNDIDLKSAASASALNHKAHTSFGMVSKGENVDAIAGVGFYIEIPQKNTALKIWGFWFKAGATF